ncbi:hypothetical protein AT984_20835 [Paucibacter sp. KCTC 42545]|nr:hypothetical protein AT984_20835 [Paucibacter sp. KCTC 42545]
MPCLVMSATPLVVAKYVSPVTGPPMKIALCESSVNAVPDIGAVVKFSTASESNRSKAVKQ